MKEAAGIKILAASSLPKLYEEIRSQGLKVVFGLFRGKYTSNIILRSMEFCV